MIIKAIYKKIYKKRKWAIISKHKNNHTTIYLFIFLFILGAVSYLLYLKDPPKNFGETSISDAIHEKIRSGR